MDFTNFYGFVKKMVQKDQYTYNFPPGSSTNPYGEAGSTEFSDTLDTKSELLDPKKEKSPTCHNFEIFDHDPQLDMKFWNSRDIVGIVVLLHHFL